LLRPHLSLLNLSPLCIGVLWTTAAMAIYSYCNPCMFHCLLWLHLLLPCYSQASQSNIGEMQQTGQQLGISQPTMQRQPTTSKGVSLLQMQGRQIAAREFLDDDAMSFVEQLADSAGEEDGSSSVAFSAAQAPPQERSVPILADTAGDRGISAFPGSSVARSVAQAEPPVRFDAESSVPSSLYLNPALDAFQRKPPGGDKQGPKGFVVPVYVASQANQLDIGSEAAWQDEKLLQARRNLEQAERALLQFSMPDDHKFENSKFSNQNDQKPDGVSLLADGGTRPKTLVGILKQQGTVEARGSGQDLPANNMGADHPSLSAVSAPIHDQQQTVEAQGSGQELPANDIGADQPSLSAEFSPLHNQQQTVEARGFGQELPANSMGADQPSLSVVSSPIHYQQRRVETQRSGQELPAIDMGVGHPSFPAVPVSSSAPLFVTDRPMASMNVDSIADASAGLGGIEGAARALLPNLVEYSSASGGVAPEGTIVSGVTGDANQPLIPGGAGDKCTPQCTWQCTSPKCEEVCEPVCRAPRCETRCEGYDIASCSMDCNHPHCSVMCPKRHCPTRNCPQCKSVCSEPVCKLRCPQTQPCKNVCEQPSCEWNCKAPSACPAPQCHMVCESPTSCMGHSTYRELPPLRPGETSVQHFAVPHGLHEQQHRSHTTRASSTGNIAISGSVPNDVVAMMTVPVVHNRGPESGDTSHVQRSLEVPIDELSQDTWAAPRLVN